MLELRKVSKTYTIGKASVTALQAVDFTLNRGDFVVIRGPSGSGKSTLLNILGLLDSPTTGSVLLNGETITYEDYDKLAVIRSRSISFIFQAFNLNPVLTLEENVMVPLMIRNDISKEEKRRRVAEWVEHTGLTPYRHHRPDELSGGQRQRVAIARAMVAKPELVIADEPTANLDSQTSQKILELMRTLNAEQSTAFVFATHDPLLDSFARNIYRMQDGLLHLS